MGWKEFDELMDKAFVATSINESVALTRMAASALVADIDFLGYGPLVDAPFGKRHDKEGPVGEPLPVVTTA